MSVHNSSAYFKAHRCSRLAFIEECVAIWHEDQTDFLDHAGSMSAVEANIRQDVIARLGDGSPHIDHFTNVELAAFRNELVARDALGRLQDLDAPRPKKGNLRRHIPKHQPLRPSRAIIAVRAKMLKAAMPTLSVNAIYERTANHFSDGIPKSEADGRLTTRNVRSACESFGAFDADETMMTNYRRALKRFRSAEERPHVWDWDFYEAIIWDQALQSFFSRSDFDVGLSAHLQRDLPLIAFERLYDAAKSHPRFAKLAGVDLARALDAYAGLRTWAESEMEAIAKLVRDRPAITANAGRQI